MKRTHPSIAVAFLICLALLSLTVLLGCAQPSSTTSNSKASEAVSYLGPYPPGVAVRFGKTRMTLDSVAVSDLEWPYEESETAAPAGQKWIYADFAFEGPGTNPAPGGGQLFPQFRLVVEGKTTPVDLRSSGGDVEAPPGVVPHEHFTFLVPAEARSAILLVTPKFAETQTVGFRLW